MKNKTTSPSSASLSRRQFLQRSAAAASALAMPTFIPATALGRGGAVAPSERIVMGAIGNGGRGTADLHAMLGEADVQFVAVCDVRKAQREAAQRTVDSRYGTQGCTGYRDLRELLARPDLDAVLIATGDRWHALASMLAMRAGKDVYCEKPSCLTLAEGRQVVETARTLGRVYQTGAQRLSEAHHVFAIELARSGRLGPIHTVYADCRWRDGLRLDYLPAQPEPPKEDMDWDLWLGPTPWRPFNAGYVNGSGWYHFHDFATDVAMWGAHTIAQALAGLDLTNVAFVEIEYAADGGTMQARLSSGVKLMLYRSVGSVWQACDLWHGSCGERFEGPGGWAGAADGYSKPDVSAPALLNDYKQVLAEYTERTHRALNHARDFFDCVRSRRQPVANPLVMFRSMSICLAADICQQLQRKVKFDLQKFEFIGDADATRLAHRVMRAPFTA